MRILGIDPGLMTTGYGVLLSEPHRLSIVEAGVVSGGSSRDLAKRLQNLFSGIQDVVRTLEPDVMAIEALYSHYGRPTTAILMGHARGVLCLAAGLAGLPIHHYSATQIKRVLTGNGRAPKSQIQLAIARQFGLAKVPEPPDVADALSVAACHHYLIGTVNLK